VACTSLEGALPSGPGIRPSQPLDVRVISAPEGSSDYGLVGGTWALVILTGLLCWVTWRGVRATLRDAMRLRREVLVREVNAAAYRAAASAEHVLQLAARVSELSVRLRGIAGRQEELPAHADIVLRQRQQSTQSIQQHALAIASQDSEGLSDRQLGDAQRRLDAHLAQLEVLKEAVLGELAMLEREIDAAEREANQRREDQRRNEARIASEVGQCNKLIFLLGQMLTILENVEEQMFADRRRKLGRDPQWDDIGALEGAPTGGPEFIFGEYAFLLEDDAPVDQSPEVLTRIYSLEGNFRQTLARLEEHRQLWHQFNALKASRMTERGEAGMAQLAAGTALAARLRELTTWLAQDLKEWIPAFKLVFPALYRVLEGRYPGRRFIRHWSTQVPNAPPLGGG
jgi:hypothetical protein